MIPFRFQMAIPAAFTITITITISVPITMTLTVTVTGSQLHSNVQIFPLNADLKRGGEGLSEKKGFLFYFDALPLIQMLPPAQRGWLLSAVCTFAIAVAEDPETRQEDIFAQFPELEEATQMACGFLCNAIRRDTRKWLQQKEARKARKEQQEGGRTSEPERRRAEELRKYAQQIRERP